MIDPEHYPYIEDDDDLKLYINGALRLIRTAAEAVGPGEDRTDLHWVWSSLYNAQLCLERALKELKEAKEAKEAKQ